MRVVVRSSVVWSFLGLLLATPPPMTAQQHDAPVRYEEDYLGEELYRGRRDVVRQLLPENGVAFVFGAATRNRSNDVGYEYRQSSNFIYLTGSEEPGSVLLIAPGGVRVDGRTVREVLFVPPRDPAEEVWTGRRFGTERAMSELGLELAVPSTRFEEIARPILQDGTKQIHHVEIPDAPESGSALARQLEVFLEHVTPLVWQPQSAGGAALLKSLGESELAFRGMKGAPMAPTSFPDPTVRALAEVFVAASSYEEWARRRTELLAGRSEGTLLPLALTEARMTKSEEEMVLLQRAIDITVEAHREVMQQVEPGWAEYEIEALVEYTFKRNGAEQPGFPSIVGSGENSTILHYETNRRTTEPGDVVVIDIGAEYHGYTADITRTVPLDGRYSPEQRAIYEIVFAAQEAGIRASRASADFRAPHNAAAQVLAEGLARLGLISSPNDMGGLRRFFMHGTSHYLGLDVHDVGNYGPLTPGTVITVEPGIYIAAADDIDPKWWNIGVRIEDDILITEGDPVILSAGAPRQIDEVEALMRSRPVS
jgi:Xaa-Pro aminopeptidase